MIKWLNIFLGLVLRKPYFFIWAVIPVVLITNLLLDNLPPPEPYIKRQTLLIGIIYSVFIFVMGLIYYFLINFDRKLIKLAIIGNIIGLYVYNGIILNKLIREQWGGYAYTPGHSLPFLKESVYLMSLCFAVNLVYALARIDRSAKRYADDDVLDLPE